jgi:hypothetical protein
MVIAPAVKAVAYVLLLMSPYVPGVPLQAASYVIRLGWPTQAKVRGAHGAGSRTGGSVFVGERNSNITMNIYTHAISSKKRRAQSKVVETIEGNSYGQKTRMD